MAGVDRVDCSGDEGFCMYADVLLCVGLGWVVDFFDFHVCRRRSFNGHFGYRRVTCKGECGETAVSIDSQYSDARGVGISR